MIKLNELRYTYGLSSSFQLHIPQLEIAGGEKVAIVGPSGSGKTTLLKLISGAMLPSSGTVEVDHTRVDLLDDSSRRRFRAMQIGFVFQEFELLDYLSVEENIRLPVLIQGHSQLTTNQQQRLRELTSETGIADKLQRRPSQLSQGERQRVAICRALLLAPKLLLADEPTGSLDPTTAADIFQLLVDQSNRYSTTLLVVTHDHSLLRHFDRTIDFAQFLCTIQRSQSGSNTAAVQASPNQGNQ
jgi:putative ABC transport system ATP-binding protein